MKEKHQNIIKELRKNSRTNLKDISKNTKIPLTTVHTFLKNITESKKTIKKFTTLFYFEKIMHPIQILFIIKSENKKTIERISKHKNINNIYRASSSYIIECIFKDLKKANDFSENLKDNNSLREEHKIIEIIKQEEFFT